MLVNAAIAHNEAIVIKNIAGHSNHRVVSQYVYLAAHFDWRLAPYVNVKESFVVGIDGA